MADSNTDAGPAASGASRRGYSLPHQAAPLLRQWQMQLHPVVPSARGQARSQQQFHPEEVDAADSRLPPPVRRSERTMRIGLWLLVMLAVIAIGLRLLDLSAVTVPASGLAQRPAAFASDLAARAAALTASMEKDPLFDDPQPSPPVARLASPPPPTPTPTPVARLGVGLTAAAALSAQSQELPAPVVMAHRASPACSEALRAMQLCPP